MDKDIIDLQMGVRSTCAVIETKDSSRIAPSIQINASISDKSLFGLELPVFANKVEGRSKKSEVFYFVIKDIDKVDEEKQLRFVGLVKDREMNNYYLPDNCIIILTVENKENIKKISPELKNFIVKAF